jgi:hypothetical protein
MAIRRVRDAVGTMAQLTTTALQRLIQQRLRVRHPCQSMAYPLFVIPFYFDFVLRYRTVNFLSPGLSVEINQVVFVYVS